jgi:hypothetical protein
MKLQDLENISRVGPILSEHNHLDVFEFCVSALPQITSADGIAFSAPSAIAAAVWLLDCAHFNALGPSYGAVNKEKPFFKNRLLGYRGQSAKYTTLVPSLHRRPPAEQALHNHAFSWFHLAITAWESAHFKYLSNPSFMSGIEYESAIGAAQHYGLGTYLTDWSWDPLVALAFAINGSSVGDRVTVLLRDFGDDSFQIESLAKWSLETAASGKRCDVRGDFGDIDSFIRVCNEQTVAPPDLVVSRSNASKSENVSQMMDYIDMASLRVTPGIGSFAYFKPALVNVCVGLPYYSWINRGLAAALQQDERAAIFSEEASIMRYIDEVDGVLAGYELSNPWIRFSHSPRRIDEQLNDCEIDLLYIDRPRVSAGNQIEKGPPTGR